MTYLKTFGCLCYVLVDPNSRDKLDAKSKKCYLIGYGGDEFGYRLWDDVDKKIMCSQNVTFNETVVYKDKDVMESKQEVVKETVELEEITDDEVPREDVESPETSSDGVDISTPILKLRRSTRVWRPTSRYSLDVNFILIIDSGEPESYAEAKHMDDSVKWEVAMKEEVDSLHENRTWELTRLPKGKKALHNK